MWDSEPFPGLGDQILITSSLIPLFDLFQDRNTINEYRGKEVVRATPENH